MRRGMRIEDAHTVMQALRVRYCVAEAWWRAWGKGPGQGTLEQQGTHKLSLVPALPGVFQWGLTLGNVLHVSCPAPLSGRRSEGRMLLIIRRGGPRASPWHTECRWSTTDSPHICYAAILVAILAHWWFAMLSGVWGS